MFEFMKVISSRRSLRRQMVATVCLLPAFCFAGLTWDSRKIELIAKPGDKQAIGVYHFVNSSSTPLTITSVKPSCGCTTAELTKMTYAPGEAGEVKATFTFGDRIGQEEKIIQVFTDDAPSKPEMLTLRVIIPELFTCTPRMLVWQKGQPIEEKSVIFAPVGTQRIAAIEITKIVPAQATTHLEPTQKPDGFRLIVRPASVTEVLTVGIACVVRFADGQSQPMVVHALVR